MASTHVLPWCWPLLLVIDVVHDNYGWCDVAIFHFPTYLLPCEYVPNDDALVMFHRDSLWCMLITVFHIFMTTATSHVETNGSVGALDMRHTRSVPASPRGSTTRQFAGVIGSAESLVERVSSLVFLHCIFAFKHLELNNIELWWKARFDASCGSRIY